MRIYWVATPENDALVVPWEDGWAINYASANVHANTQLSGMRLPQRLAVEAVMQEVLAFP